MTIIHYNHNCLYGRPFKIIIEKIVTFYVVVELF